MSVNHWPGGPCAEGPLAPRPPPWQPHCRSTAGEDATGFARGEVGMARRKTPPPPGNWSLGTCHPGRGTTEGVRGAEQTRFFGVRVCT